MTCRSLWQTPVATVRTRISSGIGSVTPGLPRLLVDLTAGALLGALPETAPGTLALALPNAPSLAGAELFVQSLAGMPSPLAPLAFSDVVRVVIR